MALHSVAASASDANLTDSAPSPAHQRLSYAWYELGVWLCFTGMTLGFSLRSKGAKNVPKTGPALLISNHQSFLDPVLAGLAARRHLHYLARKTLFRHAGLAWLMRSLNAVPIDQEGFAREGLKTLMDELGAGHAVLVFPEGERTPDGRMQDFRPGIHLLIKKMDMPIVPVGIAGAFAAWPRHRPLPLPAPLFWPPWSGTIAVAIGQPIHSASLREKSREEALAELHRAVEKCHTEAESLRRKS
jgi:1-acyl-sn-glycerol-3-phosphate acyltransferase